MSLIQRFLMVDGFVPPSDVDPLTDWERWLAQTAMVAAETPQVPGDYRWSLEPSGELHDLYQIGLTPEEAVIKRFLVCQ